MNMLKLFFLFLAIFGAPLAALAQDNLQQAAQANSYYLKGEFAKASNAYESIYQQNTVNGYLFYNLGNAYYRQNKFSQALVYYKAAQKYLPRDGDLLANIDYTRKHNIDKIDAKFSYSDALFFWLNWANTYEFMILSGITSALTVFLFLLNKRVENRWLKLGNIFSLILCIFCFTSFLLRFSAVLESPSAVILSSEVLVKSANSESDITLFSLHQGAEVTVGETRNNWTQIMLADGKKGWVKSEDLILVPE